MTGEEQFKELYRRYIHREGAEELLEWMERETDFFTAPASTKHHLAYPGGLVEHSVNVFRELRKVVIDNEPTMEAVAICALLHDLCKANTYVREHHAGPGEVYSYVKKDRFPMGHGEKSVYLIARFMKLEDEEALAIRWHMGAWDDAVRGGYAGHAYRGGWYGMKGRRGALGQYHASMSNNRGHDFEEAIRQACLLYANQGRAKVEKTPEPFRVLEKREGGIFVGRFTAHAQPDFQGTLDGGRSIIFEAKYTTTDAMKRDVLTETQMETLERHHRCGALAAVCVGIQDRFFFVPWPVWRDMKEAFGHMSVSAAELEDFRVRFTGAVLFLDYAHKIGGRWITGADCEIERWRRSK